jgi:hypothetical protein
LELAMAVTPESLAGESEHSHQVALFAWAALNVGNDPRLKLMFAIPNGGARGNDRKSAMIRGANLKAEGVKPGVVDVFLPVPIERRDYEVGPGMFKPGRFAGLFVEMKKPAAKLKRGPNGPGPWDYGGVDQEQKDFLDAMVEQGYKCVVCYSWYEAANQIKIYLTGSGL